MAKRRALTARQKKYCELRAQGESYSKAYKGAGYSNKQSTESATSNAYNLEHLSAKSTQILQRIAELQERVEQGAIMNRQQRQALLTELAQDEEGARADRIRALDLLAKMSGDYTERVIYEGTNHISIEDAREDAWNALKEP